MIIKRMRVETDKGMIVIDVKYTTITQALYVLHAELKEMEKSE